MSKIIIANWKANPATLEEAQELFEFSIAEASKYQNIQTIICPPFVYLEELAKQMANSKEQAANVTLGAQDMLHPVKSGEVGAEQFDGVKNFGVTHVLVGHSDRRYKIGLPSTTLGQPKVVLGETDEMINKKIKAALEADITPVLLVGERNRDDDRKAVLEQQLAADLAGLTAEQISKILITYEPVWAISTTPGASPSTTFGTKVVLGKPDTPENTLGALKLISEFLSITYNLKPITYLYGGSVNQANAADFLKHPEISGAVIGGASLHKDEFAHILSQVSLLT